MRHRCNFQLDISTQLAKRDCRCSWWFVCSRCALSASPENRQTKKFFMSAVSLPHLHIVYCTIFARDANETETEIKCFFAVISSDALRISYVLIWAEFIRKVGRGCKKGFFYFYQSFNLTLNLLRANVEPRNRKISIMRQKMTWKLAWNNLLIALIKLFGITVL